MAGWEFYFVKPKNIKKDDLFDVEIYFEDRASTRIIRDCVYNEKFKTFTQIDTKEEFEIENIFKWSFSRSNKAVA